MKPIKRSKLPRKRKKKFIKELGRNEYYQTVFTNEIMYEFEFEDGADMPQLLKFAKVWGTSKHKMYDVKEYW